MWSRLRPGDKCTRQAKRSSNPLKHSDLRLTPFKLILNNCKLSCHCVPSQPYAEKTFPAH